MNAVMSQTSPHTPEAEHPPAEVIVYICPTKGCGNYFASPDFRDDRSDIRTPQEHRSQDGSKTKTHARVECPDCRARGKKVKRVPWVVTEVVNLDRMVAHVQKEAKKK